LKDEGYIDDFAVKSEGAKSELNIALKYYAGRPVIERIEASRSLVAWYRGRNDIPVVMNGLGLQSCRRPGCDDRPQGRPDRRRGEVLCYVA